MNRKIQISFARFVLPLADPDELEFVPSLPKTRSGKVMRLSCVQEN